MNVFDRYLTARCFPLSSFCDRMAPVAHAEASTCRKNGQLISGWANVGPSVMAVIKVSSVVQHSVVQTKGVFFFVRAVRGRAMLA